MVATHDRLASAKQMSTESPLKTEIEVYKTLVFLCAIVSSPRV